MFLEFMVNARPLDMFDMTGAKSKMRGLACMAACVVATGFALPAYAQRIDEKTADAKVVVVRPLSFLEVTNLHFGKILASNTAGSVTIAPNGNRTKTGGITLVDNDHRPAEFAGMGSRNQRVDISLSSNTIFLNGPGTQMRVREFVIGSTPTAILTTTPRRFRIASVNGLFQFPVGATLDVNASQQPGIYRGTWNITLNYQ
jgi:hypothetical protein